MKDTFIFISALLFVMVILFFTDWLDQGNVKVYDCSVSEISPDYPLDVKEECRRLRREQYKENRKTLST
jgi:hypothetical protein